MSVIKCHQCRRKDAFTAFTGAGMLGDEPMFSSFAAVKGTFSCERLDTDMIGDLRAFLEQEKDSLLIPRNFELGTGYTEAERLFRLLIMNYLNRLFHKYYGSSLYACRLTDKEISLYHEKPWEVEKLAEDIYRL